MKHLDISQNKSIFEQAVPNSSSYKKGSILNRLPELAKGKYVLIFILPICIVIGVFLALEQYVLALGLLSVFLPFFIFVFPYIGLIVFFGLTYARPQDYVPGLMGKPVILILLGATIVFWLVHILAFQKREFVKAPQNLLLIAFLLVITISTSRVWLIGAKDSFIEFFKIILTYLLIINLTDTHKKFSILLWIMFAGTVYIALLGIFQHYGVAPALAGTTPDINRGRIQGFGIFNNANYLAYGTAFMIPFALYSFYYSRALPIKLISLAVVPAIFLQCIYYTGSRGGTLCAVFTIAFTIFQDRKTKTSVIGILVSLALFFILINMVSYLGNVDDYQDDSSAMGRVEAWSAGFDMLKSSPLLGVGYNQFREHWVLVAHNAYVQVGSELGIIGLYIWLGMLYYSYKCLRKVTQISTDTSQRVHAKSLKATFLAFCIGSCFTALGYFMLLYIFHSFSVIAANLYLPEEEKREINHIKSKDLLIIAGIEFLVLCGWYIFPKL